MGKSLTGRRVFLYFFLFFGVVACVDAVFIYMATTTYTGLVVENPYEKGLAYDEVLSQAKAQPNVTQKASYECGVLRWVLHDEAGLPLEKAVVRARIIRSVKEGHDFDVVLAYKGGGLYEAPLSLPFSGIWMAKLSSRWNNESLYQTTHSFIAP